MTVIENCDCTIEKPVTVVSYKRTVRGREQHVSGHCRSRKGQHT